MGETIFFFFFFFPFGANCRSVAANFERAIMTWGEGERLLTGPDNRLAEVSDSSGEIRSVIYEEPVNLTRQSHGNYIATEREYEGYGDEEE